MQQSLLVTPALSTGGADCAAFMLLATSAFRNKEKTYQEVLQLNFTWKTNVKANVTFLLNLTPESLMKSPIIWW